MTGRLRLRDARIVHEGYLTVVSTTFEGPDGEEIRREIEHHGQAAAVLPYDPERRVALLVRLPRAPVVYAAGPAEMLEAPAGMLDDEDAAAAAVREAMEEAGVRLSRLEPLGAPFSSPGVSTERIALFLAPYAASDRTGPGGGVEGEHELVRADEVALSDLWATTEAGRIEDLKTLALILALKVRRPELFRP